MTDEYENYNKEIINNINNKFYSSKCHIGGAKPQKVAEEQKKKDEKKKEKKEKKKKEEEKKKRRDESKRKYELAQKQKITQLKQKRYNHGLKTTKRKRKRKEFEKKKRKLEEQQIKGQIKNSFKPDPSTPLGKKVSKESEFTTKQLEAKQPKTNTIKKTIESSTKYNSASKNTKLSFNKFQEKKKGLDETYLNKSLDDLLKNKITANSAEKTKIEAVLQFKIDERKYYDNIKKEFEKLPANEKDLSSNYKKLDELRIDFQKPGLTTIKKQKIETDINKLKEIIKLVETHTEIQIKEEQKPKNQTTDPKKLKEGAQDLLKTLTLPKQNGRIQRLKLKAGIKKSLTQEQIKDLIDVYGPKHPMVAEILKQNYEQQLKGFKPGSLSGKKDKRTQNMSNFIKYKLSQKNIFANNFNASSRKSRKELRKDVAEYKKQRQNQANMSRKYKTVEYAKLLSNVQQLKKENEKLPDGQRKSQEQLKIEIQKRINEFGIKNPEIDVKLFTTEKIQSEAEKFTDRGKGRKALNFMMRRGETSSKLENLKKIYNISQLKNQELQTKLNSNEGPKTKKLIRKYKDELPKNFFEGKNIMLKKVNDYTVNRAKQKASSINSSRWRDLKPERKSKVYMNQLSKKIGPITLNNIKSIQGENANKVKKIVRKKLFKQYLENPNMKIDNDLKQGFEKRKNRIEKKKSNKKIRKDIKKLGVLDKDYNQQLQKLLETGNETKTAKILAEQLSKKPIFSKSSTKKEQLDEQRKLLKQLQESENPKDRKIFEELKTKNPKLVEKLEYSKNSAKILYSKKGMNKFSQKLRKASNNNNKQKLINRLSPESYKKFSESYKANLYNKSRTTIEPTYFKDMMLNPNKMTKLLSNPQKPVISRGILSKYTPNIGTI